MSLAERGVRQLVKELRNLFLVYKVTDERPNEIYKKNEELLLERLWHIRKNP